MRIDNLLFEAGCGGRNHIKKLLKSKQVTVDGQVVTKPSLIVDSHLQTICVSGRKIETAPMVYYLLNKPAGVVTACSDKEHQTVLDLLAKEDRREGIYPVGRLDRDTEGLVLLTNNGPLGFRMLHPKQHVSKTYYVEVNGFLADDAPAFFENGVTFLDGTICKPTQLEILTAQEETSSAHLTISEGKFHQIKKMFLAYGLKVTLLRRISFGGFHLDDHLKKGQYRSLHSQEIDVLKNYLD